MGQYNCPQTKQLVEVGLILNIDFTALIYIEEEVMYLSYLLDVGLKVVQNE